MDNTLVSVIMPAFNADAYISQSIRSVKNQTYRDWELLIIDDASSDETAEIVADFMAGDQRIKLHSLPTNQGAGFCRNIGIKASIGKFVCFLDADDLWKPKKLDVQLKFMKKRNLSLSYSSYELISEAGINTGEMIKALPRLSFKKLLRANYIGNLTGIYDAEAIGKVYCPLVRKRQDWGLWLLAIQKAGRAEGISEPLAQYRLRKGSISQNKWEMLGYNYGIYRRVLQFSVIKSVFWMFLFLWEQLLVKRRQQVDLE